MDVTLSQYRVYYKRLAAKMAFAIVIVAAVPLIVMAAVSRHYFVGAYKQKVLDHLTTLFRMQEEKVGIFVSAWFDALRLMGGATSFELLSDETVLQDRWSTLQGVYGRSLVGLAFYDRQGALLSSAGSPGIAKSYKLAPEAVARVLDSGSYIVQTHHAGSDTPLIDLAVTLEQSSERRILMATVEAEALILILKDFQRAQVGRTVIISKSGETVVSVPSERTPPRIECLELEPKISLQSHGVILGETGDGSTLCVRKALKDSDWVLEFTVDTREAYQAFSHPRMFILSILLLGVAGIGVVAIIVANRISRYVARVDQEKQLMNEQVVQAGKVATLGEMASNMAHEINNPVGIMVQEAQWIDTLLGKGTESPTGNLDEIRGSLKEIQVQGGRCRDIILKLIDFTRRDEPDIQRLQLNELVHEIVGLCQQRASSMNIELRLNLDPELPFVSAAPADVHQVLINLLNNSLDAMEHEGGVLDVRTSTRAGYVLVEVMDTGPGIARKNLGRVFDPFFSTKPEGKGTGLGLSICYSVMKKMKGDIAVASEEGRGTTFQLFFPTHERL